MKPETGRAWPRRARRLLVMALVAGTSFNMLCIMHARAMTRFVEDGERTADPEALGWTGRARAVLLGVRVPRPRNARAPDALGLAFTTHVVRTRRGARLEAWHVPAERSRGLILLFHGYAASKAQLLETAHALHAERWSLVLVDFEGSGGSSGNTTTIGYREAEDVAATVEWTRAHLGVDAPVLYGFSMGSAAILRAVGEAGVPARAIVVEAPFDRMLSTTRHRFELMGIPSFPSAELLVFWGGRLYGFDGLAHDPVDYASTVRVPALVLCGDSDARVRVSEARAVASAASATLVVFEGVGHAQLVTADRLRWRQTVLPFLDSVAAR